MDDRGLIASLVAVAEGQPHSELLEQRLTAERQTRLGLSGLREFADVLSASEAASRLAVRLGTELFRSQAEFNHASVDVLEDLPWLAGRTDAGALIQQRLGRWVRFSARLGRGDGNRAALRSFAIGAILVAAERAERSLLDGLLTGNQWVVDTLTRLASLQPLTSRPPFWELKPGARERPFRPWLEAQSNFLEAVERLVVSNARRLVSRAAAVEGLPAMPVSAAPHPTVSVLWAGSGAAPTVDGALEVVTEVAEAQGEVLIRLPPGEVILPGGLAALARAFDAPAIDLAYGDVQLADGSAVFRPGWSPETLWCWSYVGGCFAIRTRVAQKAGLTREKPALEWLLAPRFTEARVARVPFRTSRGPQPPHTLADSAVVEADLARRKVSGLVRLNGPLREVHLAPAQDTRVSIIVPFRDKPELLEGLWKSLVRYDAGVDWQLILVNNSSVEGRTARLLGSLTDPRVHHFDANQPFNYSALNNAGAARASGDLLLFLNNDIAVRHDGWLADLAGYAQLPEVGAVGARLLYADGSLQHAGVAIGLKGLAGHVFARWRPEYGPTPFGPPQATRNWSAVTGACLMLRRDTFTQVGGFDERIAVSGGDIALCLKLRERGLRVVCVGHVELSHFESLSRGKGPVPRGDVMREVVAYRRLLESGDPHYHPALSTEAAHGGPGLHLESPADHAVRALLPWL